MKPSTSNDGTSPSSARFDLANFSGRNYDKGRSLAIQALWLAASWLVVMKWWCPAALRVLILRMFGAKIGDRVLIRHDVKVHWPWKLSIGHDSWIGQGAWLLNLEPIDIGSNSCISQEALICTGSHDRRSPTFEFDNAPIWIGSGVWVAARATILRGVRIGDNATIGACCLVSGNVAPGATVVAPPANTIAP